MTFDNPVLASRTIPLDLDLVLGGQGLPAGARVGAPVLEAAAQALDIAPSLLDARFMRASAPICARTPARVETPVGCFEGDTVADALDGAARLVGVVCTLGSPLDQRVSALLPANPLLALALDGLGSGACQRLAGLACREIEAEAAADDMQVTGPIAPGSVGWPLLEGQRQIWTLVDPSALGVTLTSSGQMIPRKSLSFVVGVGRSVHRRAACPACGARHRCTFRPDHG